MRNHQAMQSGKILNFHEDKGYGFIRPDGGRGFSDNVFFHYSIFRPCDVTPRVGAKVMFIEGVDERSGRARATYVEEA
jgi:cold shock CspA family protein